MAGRVVRAEHLQPVVLLVGRPVRVGRGDVVAGGGVRLVRGGPGHHGQRPAARRGRGRDQAHAVQPRHQVALEGEGDRLGRHRLGLGQHPAGVGMVLQQPGHHLGGGPARRQPPAGLLQHGPEPVALGVGPLLQPSQVDLAGPRPPRAAAPAVPGRGRCRGGRRRRPPPGGRPAACGPRGPARPPGRRQIPPGRRSGRGRRAAGPRRPGRRPGPARSRRRRPRRARRPGGGGGPRPARPRGRSRGRSRTRRGRRCGTAGWSGAAPARPAPAGPAARRRPDAPRRAGPPRGGACPTRARPARTPSGERSSTRPSYSWRPTYSRTEPIERSQSARSRWFMAAEPTGPRPDRLVPSTWRAAGAHLVASC